MQNRLEEAASCRPAPAALLVDVEITDAFVITGIEVIDSGNSVLVRRLAECIENLPAQPRIFDPPFSAGRVVLAFQKMIDVLAEIGPHIFPRPSGQTELAPIVVVGRLAEHVDHSIEDRKSTRLNSSHL